MHDSTNHVALAHTLEFVARHLTGGAERVLEVGCGGGQLAAELKRRGLRVSAIDSDAACVRAARLLGVDARHATWPDSDQGPYDAVLFTRSLHHIAPLGAAVQRARDVLRPGGRVIVEDFSFAEADAATAEWLRGVLVLLDAAGLLDRGPEDFQAHLIESTDALDAWRREHGHSHELHAWPVMRDELRRCFERVEASEEPYLYRYCRFASGDGNLPRRILELEACMIQRRLIAAIGRRFVGRRL